MQPKGAIDFNNQNATILHSNAAKKKELLKKVFAVDQTSPIIEKPDEAKTQDQNDQESHDVGHQDFLKEETKETEKSAKKLDDLTDIAELILYRTKTTNPIDLFPDEVIVDMNKISVIHNKFFLSSRIHSVMISDVSDIMIETGLFWAKLIIVDKDFIENTIDVEFLNKDQALRIRRIVQGLVVAQQQKVDFTKLLQELTPAEIIAKLEKLGKARTGQ